MYELTTNPDLPADGEIEVRHAPYRGIKLSGIKKGDRVVGIPVLTGFETNDWPVEGAQWEINPTKQSDTPSYEKWAKGWLVGEVWASQNDSGEGVYAFRARGYVHRNELLVPKNEGISGIAPVAAAVVAAKLVSSEA